MPDQPPRPVRALLQVLEHTTALVPSVVANSGYVTVYQQTVAVQAGDTLRVRGQIEFTNDFSSPVRGHILLLVGGAAVGSGSSQNNVMSGTENMHHMPLWADAVYPVTTTGNLLVEAQLATGRSGASPSMKVEDGYGHLLIEHYRLYPSTAAASAQGARLLEEVLSDRTPDAAHFGTNAPSVRVLAYNVSLTPGASDLIRLLGQATSQWDVGLEMHGQGIFEGTTRLSPWSTENTLWSIQTTPLWTDAVHTPGASPRTYSVSMHGVFGVGAIISPYGHLYVLRFAPVRAPDGIGQYELAESVTQALASTTSVTSNAGWVDILSAPVSLKAGDRVRSTGYLQLEYPAGFSLGISCLAETALLDSSQTAVDLTQTPKYITQLMEELPLRTELVAQVSQGGAYTLRTRAQCTREAASPVVQAVAGAGTLLLVERFARR